MMEIRKGTNKFYIGYEEKEPLAEILLDDFNKDAITVTHTYVSEKLKGQGAAKKLVKRVVDFAREENKKVIPVCEFAKKEFAKNKEYENVLDNSVSI
ncbi:GNAT family N-acetyltransferase [Clostridium sp. WILCCON 0269]|uniref:GNAT family N-acetyltransferase n=1 Tax=Candidatus Clostridium eludens TaxID=3381663 RepID=A0ABW8SPW7_9CLOT